MKYLIATAAILAASSAHADVSKVKVFDHTKVITQSVPVTETRCSEIQVPIYETVTRQGNAAEGAVLGMIIGGISGKAISGKDDGAAAGAIIGGLIGADKGSTRTEQRIIGYNIEQQCNNVNVYQNSSVEVYSHSTIRFYLDGKRYVLRFDK
jgi:uncharacterized protein YcfJ